VSVKVIAWEELDELERELALVRWKDHVAFYTGLVTKFGKPTKRNFAKVVDGFRHGNDPVFFIVQRFVRDARRDARIARRMIKRETTGAAHG
jgi:hypothetical protein